MLTEEEIKELKKLPTELREKIESIFSNPNFNAWKAVRNQIDAICNELIDAPKIIEEEIDYAKYASFDNVDKIIQAIAATSRGKSETALKWMKEMEDLVKAERNLWDKLTPQEKELSVEPTLENISKELKSHGK